jgi:hypothetical protein
VSCWKDAEVAPFLSCRIPELGALIDRLVTPQAPRCGKFGRDDTEIGKGTPRGSSDLLSDECLSVAAKVGTSSSE